MTLISNRTRLENIKVWLTNGNRSFLSSKFWFVKSMKIYQKTKKQISASIQILQSNNLRSSYLPMLVEKCFSWNIVWITNKNSKTCLTNLEGQIAEEYMCMLILRVFHWWYLQKSMAIVLSKMWKSQINFKMWATKSS